jgi:hypothetical protein
MNVACTRPADAERNTFVRNSSGTNRVRSAWESTRLSYSGRKRAGGGISGRQGHVGQVEQLVAPFVSVEALLRLERLDMIRRPDRTRPRLYVLDRPRPERRKVAKREIARVI